MTTVVDFKKPNDPASAFNEIGDRLKAHVVAQQLDTLEMGNLFNEVRTAQLTEAVVNYLREHLATRGMKTDAIDAISDSIPDHKRVTNGELVIALIRGLNQYSQELTIRLTGMWTETFDEEDD